MSLLGVDPGRWTGFAAIDPDRKTLLGLGFCEVPDSAEGFANVYDSLLGFEETIDRVVIERPFVHRRGAQSVVTQGITVGIIKATVFEVTRLWPIEVSPQATKKALTGRSDAGARKQKGVQKALMIGAAVRFPGFVVMFETLAMKRRMTLAMTNRAREACADALAVALAGRTVTE